MVSTKYRKPKSGQALAELALILPIFLVLVFGIIDLARFMFTFSQTIDATRQAIRYGIVTGLEAGSPQYFDCMGITQTAENQLVFPGIQDVTVSIAYENTQGDPLTSCAESLTAFDVNHGDVLVITVESAIVPLTPVFTIFTDVFEMSYTSRRTIVAEGAAYTSEWASSPPAAENFTATVDCYLTADNVSFTWDPMITPTRAEIMDTFTHEIVAELNTTPPSLISNAFCDNCASLGAGEYAMYYLVAYSGYPPNEVAGPPSTEAYVSCDLGGTGEIAGEIWEDQNGDGLQKTSTPKDEGIANLTVTLTWAGADDDLATAEDNMAFTQITDANGVYSFTDLPVGLFELTVDTTRTASTTYPLQITLADGETSNGNDIGFGTSGAVEPTGTGEIAGEIWEDQNGDGLQKTSTPKDEGIANLTVTLTWAGADDDLATTEDNATFTQITDAKGEYSFIDLPVGLFELTVDTTRIASTTYPLQITLADGETSNGNDIGFNLP